MPTPYILHVDMDSFFASVEQVADPRLRGRPLIVGGRASRTRTVVCAASYEAKRLGIDSGMSCQEAFRRCPQAAFVVADSAKYLYVSRKIAQLLQRFSPQVEAASIDEFYLDVTGCDVHWGGYESLGRAVKQEIHRECGITGSVGIALNRLIAKVASKLRKPDGLVVLEPEQIFAALAHMPVEMIPGIARGLTPRLQALGIRMFGDLARPDRKFFLTHFGKIGLWLYAAAHPEPDALPVAASDRERPYPKSVGHSYTLPHNIYRREEILTWIRLLCEMVSARLRRYRLESTTVHVSLRQPDMRVLGREKNFQVPGNDSGELFLRACHIWERLCPNQLTVRALGVSCRALSPEVREALLPSARRRRNVCRAQDVLNERFGEWTVYPARIALIGTRCSVSVRQRDACNPGPAFVK